MILSAFKKELTLLYIGAILSTRS